MNVIDIESYRGWEKEEAYCVVISYKRIYKKAYGHDCIAKILDWIFLNTPNKTIFYAHNLTFDGMMIINNMGLLWEIYPYETSLRGCNIYTLGIKRKGKIIIFKCSFRLLPMALNDIAPLIGVEGKMNFQHNVNRKDLEDPSFRKKALEYCEHDVYMTKKFVERFNWTFTFLLPEWSLCAHTISGVALRLFSKKFNKLKINLKLDKRIEDLVRLGYYGGRCEVFGNAYDDELVRHFDFSGMYSNRLKEKYPIDNPRYELDCSDVTRCGFYSVDTYCDNMDLPILPYREIKTGKLKFVNGFVSGVYWYEELKLFVDNGGTIKKINWGLIFEGEGEPFLDFANFCLSERKKSALNNVLWKLVPNSLIGRLGLRIEDSETIIVENSEYEPWKYNPERDKLINDKWIVKVKKDVFSRTNSSGNVIYASIVTSKARILWWNSASEVVKNGGRLLYCDTDSLYVAFKEEVLGKKMGEVEWDPEKQDTVVEDSCFVSSKFYATKYKNGEVIKIKGVRKKVASNCSLEEIKKLFYGDGEMVFKQDVWNKKGWTLIIRELNKTIILKDYDKRIFIKNKKETKPYFLSAPI